MMNANWKMESTEPAADLSDNASPVLPASTAQTRAAVPADRLALFYEPCPQGEDCAGDGKHRRLFDCDQGCGFRGCAACMEVHETEPHLGDTETTLERFRDGQV